MNDAWPATNTEAPVEDNESIKLNETEPKAADDFYKEQKKERRQLLKLACLQFTSNLRLFYDNGDPSLTKEQALEAAKEFYNFIRT